jgi:hypothetical protein
MISHWLWSCSFCDLRLGLCSCSFCDLRLVQLSPQRTPFLDLDGFVDGDLAGRRRRIHIWHRASSLSAVVNFAARIAAGTFNFGLSAMSLRVTATRGSTAIAFPDMLTMELCHCNQGLMSVLYSQCIFNADSHDLLTLFLTPYADKMYLWSYKTQFTTTSIIYQNDHKPNV